MSPAAKLLETPNNTPFPVILFSHGLGGNRHVYVVLCLELASQGYVVVALEHTDGSASAAKLGNGSEDWMFYKGIGDEEAQVSKTKHRRREMETAVRLVNALSTGCPPPSTSLVVSNLTISKNNKNNIDAAEFFKGRLDTRCIAAIGHSYGGATAAAFCSEQEQNQHQQGHPHSSHHVHVGCCICLDPWWPALYPESSALTSFKSNCPLLILGSHDWNVPNVFGEFMCGIERQEAVMKATTSRQENDDGNKGKGKEGAEGGGGGGGALLFVLKGTSHNSFADPLPLFEQAVGWLLKLLGITARLDPVLGIHLLSTVILAFLSAQLPLLQQQRELQNWTPSDGGGPLALAVKKEAQTLKLVKEGLEDDTNTSGDDGGNKEKRKKKKRQHHTGGRGLLYTVSDYILDSVLAKRGGDGPSKTTTTIVNDDLVTGEELLETVMPSEQGPEYDDATNGGGGGIRLSEERRAALRASAGKIQLRGKIRGEEDIEYLAALIGEHHVFKARSEC